LLEAKVHELSTNTADLLVANFIFTPDTPRRREEIWAPAARHWVSNSDTFEISGCCNTRF
jgi:hypothetical protein